MAQYAALTKTQRAAAEGLLGSWRTSVQVRFDPATNNLSALTGIRGVFNGKTPEAAVKRFWLAAWPTLQPVLAMQSGDKFFFQRNEGVTDRRSGQSFLYERRIGGLPVFGDFMQLHVAPHDPAGYTISGLTVRSHRQAATFTAPSKLIPVAAASKSIEAQGGGPFKLTHQHQTIYLSNGKPRLAYRMSGQQNGTWWSYFVDVETGAVLRSSKQEAHASGYIRAGATNPFEAYDPAVGKTMKPLPYANIYRGVSGTPIRGNSTVFHGRTDYNGYYDLPSQQSDGTIGTNDWVVDFKNEAPTNFWFPGFFQLFSTLAQPETADMTSLLSTILLLNPGSTYDIPWSSTWKESRRVELAYHFAYAREAVKLYGSTSQHNNLVILGPTAAESVPCDQGGGVRWAADCPGGLTSCGVPGECYIEIGCGLFAAFPGFFTTVGEMYSRYVLYHEFGHNVDLTSRGYWATASAIDFPNLPSTLTEGFGPWMAGLLSGFEAEFQATIGDTASYPGNYSCTDIYAGVPLTNIYNDYISYAGTLASKAILQHLSLIDNSSRLTDCTDIAGFDLCTNTNTLHAHLVTKARDPYTADWQTVFEATKAYHNRIDDAKPDLSCIGNVATIGDLPKNQFPFADDTTNVSSFTSVWHLDTPTNTVDHTDTSTPWGTVSVGPDSCISTSESSCKRLALDYAYDRDKWGIPARGGETYTVKTRPDHLAVDTRMDITDADGYMVWECGPSGIDQCSNDDCSVCPTGADYCSCLTFKPSSTNIYRVVVYPYQSSGWNSEVGSAARYTVQMTQDNDDHGDVASAATPVPADGVWREAYLNSGGPQDLDFYYAVVPTGGILSYGVCGFGGAFGLSVKVYDQNLNLLKTYTGYSCSGSDTLAVTKGVYYFEVYHGWNGTGRYQFQTNMVADIGDTVGTALDIQDTQLVFPNAIRAVGAKFESPNDVDVYKFSLTKGQIVTLDAVANPVGAAAPQLRLYRPTNAFYNKTTQICDPTTKIRKRTTASGPIFILRDTGGAIVRDTDEVQQGAHLSLVAPVAGDYYLEVSNSTNTTGGYILYHHTTGAAFTNYPVLP